MLGQRQVLTAGISRADSGKGNRRQYASPVANTAANPYIPYPGAPAGIPRVDVFDFNPDDPLYSEPRNGLLSGIRYKSGTVRTVGYVSMVLTAFDRWHVNTGVRYNEQDTVSVLDTVCTTTTGACAGKKIGDMRDPAPVVRNYSGHHFSWPPTCTLGYDLTRDITLYGAYHDIYQDQSSPVDVNLVPLPPPTGSNIEGGVKWQARDGRLNLNLSGYLNWQLWGEHGQGAGQPLSGAPSQVLEQLLVSRAGVARPAVRERWSQCTDERVPDGNCLHREKSSQSDHRCQLVPHFGELGLHPGRSRHLVWQGRPARERYLEPRSQRRQHHRQALLPNDGSDTGGNWYGPPRSFMLTMRGQFL